MAHLPTPLDLAFVSAARFGRLATTDARGVPSVVPVCFAVIELAGEPVVVSALDDKPKSVGDRALKRVRNIGENHHVALLVSHDDEDWTTLSYVQLRGQARLIEPGEPGFDAAVQALRDKYAQYAEMAIEHAPVIAISALTATSWRASGQHHSRERPEDLIALVQGRRSVRALRPDPVPPSLVKQAIVAAGWAPSPHGRQPWRFAVMERPERKIALADAMAESWRSQLALDGQAPAVIEIRLAKSRNRIVTAPIVVVPCLYLEDLDEYPDRERQAAEHLMAVQSLGAAIQNFLLTIYSSGLDSGWMCAPLFCPETVRESLGLHRGLIPQALLPVGYAAKDPVRRPRLPLEQLIVNWE